MVAMGSPQLQPKVMQKQQATAAEHCRICLIRDWQESTSGAYTLFAGSLIHVIVVVTSIE